MAIQALALLRLDSLEPVQGAPAVRVERLDDAVLVHTQAGFASDPDELVDALVGVFGAEALAAHEDPRGILFIPHVAAPKARTYEAVVQEVGEGGTWAAWGHEDHSVAQYGDIGGLLGGVFAELPPSLVNAATDFAQGRGGSLDDMASQVQAMLGNSPALQNLVEELQRDPAKFQQLAQSLFNGSDDEEPKK